MRTLVLKSFETHWFKVTVQSTYRDVVWPVNSLNWFAKFLPCPLKTLTSPNKTNVNGVLFVLLKAHKLGPLLVKGHHALIETEPLILPTRQQCDCKGTLMLFTFKFIPPDFKEKGLWRHGIKIYYEKMIQNKLIQMLIVSERETWTPPETRFACPVIFPTWFPVGTVHWWPGNWRSGGSGGGAGRCWFRGTWWVHPPGRGHSVWLPSPPHTALASLQEHLRGERSVDDIFEFNFTSNLIFVSQQLNGGPHTQSYKSEHNPWKVKSKVTLSHYTQASKKRWEMFVAHEK